MKDYFNVKYEEMIYIGDNESKDFIITREIWNEMVENIQEKFNL